MKLASFLGAFVSAALLPGVAAVECGNWATSDCVGDDDKRYDKDYTSDLKELHPVWSRYEGFFAVTMLVYGPDGLPLETDFEPAGNAYTTFPRFGFYNITIVGSRLFQHRYIVNPPASAEFCERTVPPGSFNAEPPGVCGVNGISWWGDVFGVTSYEKDGSVATIGTTAKNVEGDTFQKAEGYTAVPVDDMTVYASAKAPPSEDRDVESVFLSETTVFVDDDGSRASSVYDFFADVPGIGNVLVQSWRQSLQRLPDEDAFVQAIAEAYETYGVLPVQQAQGGALPMEGQCLGETCPTEEDWCEYDPECSESPYQEPDATVNGGVIAGFTILGFVILIGLLYLWHRRLLAKQAQRYRSKFARRIAETVDLSGSTRQVTPEALVKEFDRIDNEHKDGYISKEELWEFVSSGKAGEMSEKDFEALYAAIDLDKNGRVDFLEFCAFMGKCDVEFEEMKTRQSVVAARPSMVQLTASRLASSKNITVSGDVLVEGSEEEEAGEKAE